MMMMVILIVDDELMDAIEVMVDNQADLCYLCYRSPTASS